MSQVIILLVNKANTGLQIKAFQGLRGHAEQIVTTNDLNDASRFDSAKEARSFLAGLTEGLGHWRAFILPADGESAVPIEEGASL